MIYFLVKVAKKGKEKIVALNEQGLDTSLNVACPKSSTAGKPVGTIFWCYGLSRVGSGTSAYYRTSAVHEYVEDSSGTAVVEAYKAVQKKMADRKLAEGTSSDDRQYPLAWDAPTAGRCSPWLPKSFSCFTPTSPAAFHTHSHFTMTFQECQRVL